MSNLIWSVKRFDQLSADDFHDIIKLRVDVFIVEQNCPYSEVDDLDRTSLHVQGILGDELVAYARIIPSNVTDPHVHIGRVIVKKNIRGSGVGHQLMSQIMLAVIDRYPDSDVELAAQSQLTDYYAKHGFKIIGEEYPWDGIPHKDMLLRRGTENDHKRNL